MPEGGLPIVLYYTCYLVYIFAFYNLYIINQFSFSLNKLIVVFVGVLYIYEKLDYEVKNQYLLTLRATDSTSKTYAEVPVNVVVTDVNDCTPKFSADFYNVTVAENTPVGSYVFQVAATDNDTGNKGIPLDYIFVLYKAVFLWLYTVAYKGNNAI